MDTPLKWFEDFKLIAVIRSGSSEDAEEMIKAAVTGGFKIFEISMHTPQAIRLLETHSKREGLFFGAGSVTDGEMAQRAVNAGARFLSSHYTDRDVISVAKNNDSFVIQGAMTPTEAVNAYQLGVDLIKVYDVKFLGGAPYLKSLRGPLPFLKLVASGGIESEEISEYLKHCVAISIGKSLFEKTLVRSDKWTELAERAKQFTQKVESLKIAK